jgi:hypothetical protein
MKQSPLPGATPASTAAQDYDWSSEAGLDGSGRPVNRLAILPGRSHYDILSAPELPGASLPDSR